MILVNGYEMVKLLLRYFRHILYIFFTYFIHICYTYNIHFFFFKYGMCGWHRWYKHTHIIWKQRINKYSTKDPESKSALQERQILAQRHDQPHAEYYDVPIDGCSVIAYFKHYQSWFEGDEGDLLLYYFKCQTLLQFGEPDYFEDYQKSSQNHNV